MAEKLITLAGCHTKSAFLHIVKHLGKNTEIEAGGSVIEIFQTAYDARAHSESKYKKGDNYKSSSFPGSKIHREGTEIYNDHTNAQTGTEGKKIALCVICGKTKIGKGKGE